MFNAYDQFNGIEIGGFSVCYVTVFKPGVLSYPTY